MAAGAGGILKFPLYRMLIEALLRSRTIQISECLLDTQIYRINDQLDFLDYYSVSSKKTVMMRRARQVQ